MTGRRRAFILTCLCLCAGLVGLEAQRGGRGPRWEQLGERTVTDRADHDVIAAAGQGVFTAVRIDVAGHAVDFHRVTVHFGNGADQNVDLRQTIPAGGSSRVIDLDGRDRVIKTVEFWYDARTIGRGGKAVVRLMGRH